MRESERWILSEYTAMDAIVPLLSRQVQLRIADVYANLPV